MMTAAEAIASIREDIDRLAEKNLVKPGYIARKRAEVAAIERELNALQADVDRAEFALADAQREHAETDLRLGMLANVLTMIGINPMVHLNRPLSDNPQVYHDAAWFTAQLRGPNSNRSYTTAQQKDIIANAIWAVRLHHRLTPTEPLTTLLHAAQASEEEQQARA